MKKAISGLLGVMLVSTAISLPLQGSQEGTGTINYGIKKIQEAALIVRDMANNTYINAKQIAVKPANYLFGQGDSQAKTASYATAGTLMLVAGGYKVYQYYLKSLQQKSLLHQFEVACNIFYLRSNEYRDAIEEYNGALEQYKIDREKYDSGSFLKKLVRLLVPTDKIQLLEIYRHCLMMEGLLTSAECDGELAAQEAMKAGVRTEVLNKLQETIEQKYTSPRAEKAVA